MKIYLTYWCNNEPYEDYWEEVRGVYSTRKKAVASIEKSGYVKGAKVEPFNGRKERWNKGAAYDEDGQPWQMHSMWVREMEVDAE